MIGEKYGRLMVLAETCRGAKRCFCRCECGKRKAIAADSLKRGRTRSCGCLNSQKASQRKTTHGLRGSRFYKAWANMKQRCQNAQHPQYADYGGRGIDVAAEWQTFERFKADMYDSYRQHAAKHGEAQTTLDRINNDAGYSPDNCRWATYSEQNSNQRKRRRNKH